MPSKKGDRLCWEAALFFALYLILPNYFAAEFHEKLPLLTASRALLLLLGLMLVLRHRSTLLHPRQWSFKKLNLLLTQDKFMCVCLLIYFGILLAVNLTFLTETSEAIKQIFTLAAEQYALVWMLSLILDSREKLLGALRILFLASGIVGIIAAVSCVIDYNLFYLLDTTERSMLMSDYYRLGMLRAAAGFNHPVYYGAFCAVMLPIGTYFTEHDKTRSLRLLSAGAMVMNFVGLILSNSRGSMLAVGCLAGIMFFLYLARKQLKRLFITYLPIIAIALVVLILITSLTSVGVRFLGSIGDSLVDSLESMLPDKVVSFLDEHMRPEETTAPTTPAETTAPTVPEETTAPTVPEETTAPTVPGETTVPTVPEETTAPTVPEETTAPTVPEETTEPTEPPLEYGENPNGMRSRTAQLTGITWTLTHSPWTGFGPNAHVRGLVRYQFRDDQWWVSKTLDMGIVAVITQYGLIGLVGYAVLYCGVGKALLSKRGRKDPLMTCLCLSFVTYLLCQLSISSLSKFEWVLIGAIICLTNILRKEAAPTD